MSELKKYKLGDVAQIIGGGTPSTTKEEYWNGEIGWLTPRDLTGYSFKYISKGERNITEEGLKNSSARLMPEGTVLMTSRAPIGYLAIAGDELCTNQGFKSFIVDEDKINNEYLYYLLKSNIDRIKSLGTGSTFAEVSASILKSFEIKIPDLPTQRQIAQILSSLDDKIELNLQMNQTLEAMAQAIFKEWFVNFNFPGFDGELVDGLPKGWRMGKLGDISKNFDSKRIPLSSRQRAERKGEYPYYGAASILDYVDDFIFDGTYLLMGEDGTVRTDEGFPVLQYVWGKFWVNNHTHVLQGLFPFSTEYLYLFLAQTNITNLITGAVQPKINQGNMNKIKCVLPTEDVLNKFYEVINPIFDKLKTNSLQIQSLTQTRDTLLPKLMSGQLEVV